MVSQRTVSILMVDDNPADVDIVRRYLEDEAIPWDVDFESILKPEDTLDRVPEKDFDLLILDYDFPLGDGFNLTSLLSEEGYDLPMIMVTGQGSEKIASEAFKHDIRDYHSKDDLTPEKLRRSIEKVLDEVGEETSTAE